MTDEHALLGQWAAAYALGALDADDRRTFERHQAECSRCQAELASLAPLPSLVGQVDWSEVSSVFDQSLLGPIEQAVTSQYQDLERSRRRWRKLAAGALAATAAAVVIAVGLVVTRPGPAPTVAADVAASHGVTSQVLVSQVTSAQLSTAKRVWGTEVALEVTGLPPRARYQLWAVGADGQWTSVATWGPTPSGATKLVGATDVPTAQLSGLVVTSDDRADVLIRAAVAGS